MKDKNGKELKPGDTIDIGQTVNGRSEFYVESLNPLDIRYGFNHNLKYEYPPLDLLRVNRYTGEVEFVICRNEGDQI